MTLSEALKYTSDNRTHADFVDAALANPTQEIHPLAYADWLQEQGQEGLAEQVRAAVEYGKALPNKAVGITRRGEWSREKRPISVWGASGKNGFFIWSNHPSSGGTMANYWSSHTPEEAKRLVEKMQGIEGQPVVMETLKRKYPHLFPAPAPKAKE